MQASKAKSPTASRLSHLSFQWIQVTASSHSSLAARRIRWRGR